MSDIDLARKAISAIRRGFATSSQDWSQACDGVYLNGIAGSGWEPDPHDPDSVDRLHDLVVKVGGWKGWDVETTAHIREMRAGFLALDGLLAELDEARRQLKWAAEQIPLAQAEATEEVRKREAIELELEQSRAHLAAARPVLAYVALGRRYVGVEPYPDSTARRVLGAIDDAERARETGAAR